MRDDERQTVHRRLRLVDGDLLEHFRGTAAPKILAHIVADRGPTWTTNLSLQLSAAWPDLQKQFRAWWLANRTEAVLGKSNIAEVEPGAWVAHMIAARAVSGASARSHIQYDPLRTCLGAVAKEAKRIGATVHLSKLGCGRAGARWAIVQELVKEVLCERGVWTTVYFLSTTQVEELTQNALKICVPSDLRSGRSASGRTVDIDVIVAKERLRACFYNTSGDAAGYPDLRMAREIVRAFGNATADPDGMFEVMLFCVSTGIEFAHENGGFLDARYYEQLETMYGRLLQSTGDQSFTEKVRAACEELMISADEAFGYGFHEGLHGKYRDRFGSTTNDSCCFQSL